MPGEYDDFDIAGAATSIGESLFPKKLDAADGENTPALDAGTGELAPDLQNTDPAPKPEPKDPNAPDPRIVQGQNKANVTPTPGAKLPLPKSWKKEMQAEWDSMSPATQEYANTREEQVMRGIQQYANGHNAWERMIGPYAEMLIANPSVNPIQLVHGFMDYHLNFLNPGKSNDDKIDLLRKIAKTYGINIAQPQAADPNAPAPMQIPDEIKRELDENRRWRAAQEQERGRNAQTQFQRQQQETMALVNNFEAEKNQDGTLKNEYFPEVQADIIHLLKTNAEPDLPSAYAAACWRNEAVRNKLIAKQATQAPGKNTPARKPNGQFINVDAVPPAKTRAQKPGTMADTINSVIDKHYSKH